MSRLRLVAVIVQPQYVLDDGENVVPGPQVQPVTVSSADWPQVVEKLAEATAKLQDQIGETPP